MARLTLDHPKFEGGQTGSFQRELFERGESAAILLYDPERDSLLFVEQFRVGALEDYVSPWLIECVAGMVGDNESPDAVIQRETLEEAGCQVLELEKIMSYWVSPGGSSEKMHLFCGRIDSSGLGGVHGLDHENEDIRVLVVSSEDAIEMMNTGRINNSVTLMALLWFVSQRDRLILQWRKV